MKNKIKQLFVYLLTPFFDCLCECHGDETDGALVTDGKCKYCPKGLLGSFHQKLYVD